MASWYSNLVTTASKLQRTYFSGEADGDTDDDTHVCRVLRAYYTEKGQAFPAWLPPDPKAPPPPTLQQQQANRYGALGGQQQQGGAGGLSSLWDNNNNNAGGGAGGNPGRGQFVNSRNPFAAGGGGGGGGAEARPGLPGQRAGSYQPVGTARADAASPAGSAASGVSAQEKLKQRLWGGARTASPTTGGPFQPPAGGQQPAQQAQGGGNRWGWGNAGGGGGGSDGAAGGYGAQAAGRRNDRPVMSANAPWADGGFDYPGGGGGGGNTARTGRTYGLPTGPRAGLPGGPRPRG